ncbi:hypothetical protein ACFTY8_49030, partial [Streptomyces mirabilis]
SPDQVTRNVELHRSTVPEALWDDLRAQGLIRPDVPLDVSDRDYRALVGALDADGGRCTPTPSATAPYAQPSTP